MKHITLVIPCYNEEVNIRKGVLDKISNFVLEHKEFEKVIIVDDGSTDDSKKIIKRDYLPNFPFLTLIENNHGGKAMAVKTGIEKAQTEQVMFSDIDLATPLEESVKLQEFISDFDIVIGSRGAVRSGAPLIRKLMAVGFMLIRNIIIGLHGIKDTQCGFKMFNTQSAKDILSHMLVFKRKQETKGSSVSATFDLEFLFIAKRLSYSIKEVPVEWHHMETKNVNVFKDTFETLSDLARMKWYEIKHKYSFNKE